MSRAISKWVLNKWSVFVEKTRKTENYEPSQILEQLLVLSSEIGATKDSNTKELYNIYLYFFEQFNINEYKFSDSELWYSIDDVVKYDILAFKPKSNEHFILNIRDIIWNLSVFKSDISCLSCGEDNLRILHDLEGQDIFFECDICTSLFNDKLKRIEKINLKLLPINSNILKRYKFIPSK